MAIRDVVTMGFGTWGTIPFVTRLGYGSSNETPISTPGLEFTGRGRLHYVADEHRLHYTATGRLHYVVEEEDS
jgi:hypothetical protein